MTFIAWYLLCFASICTGISLGDRAAKRLAPHGAAMTICGLALCAIAFKVFDFAYFYPMQRNHSVAGYLCFSAYFALCMMGLKLIMNATADWWKTRRKRQGNEHI